MATATTTTSGLCNGRQRRRNDDVLSRHPIASIQKRGKVFVSRHNRTLHDSTSASSIISYVTSRLPHLKHPESGGGGGDSMPDFRITSSHVIMKTCPLCAKPTDGKFDNCYKLYVAIGSGAYFCHRCGSKGSWYDFKNELSGGYVHGKQGADNVGGGGGGRGGGSGVSGYRVDGQYQRRTLRSDDKVDGGNDKRGGGGKGGGGKVATLPMPPRKLNSLYISRLFENDISRKGPVDGNADDDDDDGNDDGPTTSSSSSSSTRRYNVNGTENHDGSAALDYLTRVRGLDRATLRKYGVGCARYNFPDIARKKKENGGGNGDGGGGISYVSSACVTFPWMMRQGEVEELEGMRGSRYVWRDGNDNNNATTTTGDDDDGEREDGAAFTTPKITTTTTTTTKKENEVEKKRVTEMTALERYHYRKERKKTREREREEGDEATRRKEDEQKRRQGGGGDDGKVEDGGDDDDDDDDDEANVESLHGPYVARRIKARSIEHKSWQRLDPPGGGSGLFGWHTVPQSASEIIITEGEFDAMAVWQATGRPAVSLPNGCRSFPTDILVLMERFDAVYVWMDNDGPGRDGAETFAKKLGVERCLVVRPSGKRGWRDRNTNSDTDANDDGAGKYDAVGASVSPSPPPPPPKDANEALLAGWDINELLEEATELPHERILKFSDLRDQVIHEITNPEKYRGGE